MTEYQADKIIDNLVESAAKNNSNLLKRETLLWIANNSWLRDYDLKGKDRVCKADREEIINDLSGAFGVLDFISSDVDLIYALGWLSKWHGYSYDKEPNLALGVKESTDRFHLRLHIVNHTRIKLKLKLYLIGFKHVYSDGRRQWHTSQIKARSPEEASLAWRNQYRDQANIINRIEETNGSALFQIKSDCNLFSKLTSKYFK